MRTNIILFSLLVIISSSISAQTFYGKKIDKTNIQPMSEVYAALQKQETINTKMKGTIVDVCSAKGCWMNITDGSGHEFFVQFKDYGFFMPKDVAGQKVIAQGMAFLQRVTVDELRHYAEDAGKTKEEIAKITASEISYQFVANGVMLMDAIE